MSAKRCKFSPVAAISFPSIHFLTFSLMCSSLLLLLLLLPVSTTICSFFLSHTRATNIAVESGPAPNLRNASFMFVFGDALNMISECNVLVTMHFVSIDAIALNVANRTIFSVNIVFGFISATSTSKLPDFIESEISFALVTCSNNINSSVKSFSNPSTGNV